MVWDIDSVLIGVVAMAGLFGVGGPLGPVSPGLSGAVNPLAIIGAGIYQNNPLAAFQTMGNLQQAGQQLQFQQLQQQQLMAHRNAQIELQRRQFEHKQRLLEAQQRAAQSLAKPLLNRLAPNVEEEQRATLEQGLQAAAIASPQAVISAGLTRPDEFARYQAMTPDQQQEYLKYRQAMSPFAGMQSFMSPLGGNAAQWTNQAGEQPSPELTEQQATAAGFYPKTKTATPEQAGKQAATVVASETMQSIRDALLTPEGVDRALVATMQLNVPFSQGRLVRGQLEDVLQAKLRAETGATANETELRGIIDRYLPKSIDSDEQIKDKLDRMQRFFDLSLEKTDPKLFNALKGRAKTMAPPPGFVEE